MPILPHQFGGVPVPALLRAAENGLIGFDQRLLRALLNRPGETLDALDEYLASDREHGLLDLTEQVLDLYRRFRTPRALPFYMKLLRRLQDGIPDELVEALADLGAPALEPLLELHAASAKDDRPDIVFLLCSLGVRNARISSLVEQTLATDAYEGSLCAELYGDPSIEAAVLAARAKLSPGRAHERERRVLDECLESLRTPQPRHEALPYDILAEYPEEADPLFEYMDAGQASEFLISEEPSYRARAAMSFSDEDYGDALRDRLIALARNDPAAAVRGAALRALGERIGEPAVRQLLLCAAHDMGRDVEERKGALAGIAGIAREEEVRQALLGAYENPATRAAALEGMWRSLDIGFEGCFAASLKSGDAEVLRQAIHGAGAFPLPELANELVPFFRQEELRAEALFSYALAVRHHTTPKSVRHLFEIIEKRAGGLTHSEEEAVAMALDHRLDREGFRPVYFPDEEDVHDHAPLATPQTAGSGVLASPATTSSGKTGRNDPCPCLSGKKYKKCCGAAGS